MAALPIPILEAAAAALAAMLPAAIGTTIAGVLSGAGETDRDKAEPRPIAGAVPKPDEFRKSCPADKGRLVVRRWHMSKTSRDYQARVTGFAPRTEWSFAAIEFDGFQSSQCLLQEAKARYDQFFDRHSGKPKRFFRLTGVEAVLRQARKQNAIAARNPPSKLNWYFMQPISYKYFSSLIGAHAGLVNVIFYP